MTETSEFRPQPALGVGEIISSAFSILMANFVKIFIVAFVPTLVGFLISGVLIGFEAALGITTDETIGTESIAANFLSILVDIVVYTVTTALLVQLAFDARLQRPIQVGRYFGPALSAIFPLAVLSIVTGILVTIGLALLIVPGVWLYAVFSLIAPAVVLERAGFSAMGRSAGLTKEYRWPIVGALVLMIIIAMVISILAVFAAGILTVAGTIGLILAVIIFVAVSTLATSLASIVIALIYARLREIKEGVTVDQIASVFD